MKNIYKITSVIIFLIPCILSVLFPTVISALVRDGIGICVKNVVPSLFLFIFLTKVLCESGVSEKAGCVFSPLLTKILGIPKELCGAFLIGLVGGFPNGAEACGHVYKNGKCTKEMCEYTVSLSNNCSFAFITAVVSGVLGSVKYSLIIILSEIVSIFITAVIFKKPSDKNPNLISAENCKNNKMSIRRIICKSASSAVSGILNVCGYIIICYALCGIVLNSIPHLSTAFKALVSGIFEVSCGVTAAGSLDYPENIVFCSGIIGFSGLSVILQISDVSEKFGFSPVMFIKSRVLNVFLMPTVTVLIMLLLPKNAIFAFSGQYNGYIPESENIKALVLLYAMYFAAVILFFLILYSVSLVLDKKRAKYTKK